MEPAVYRYINDAWIAVGIIWLIAAFTAKPAARVQSASSRLLHICVLGLAFVLLFTNELRFGPLAWRFVPASSVVLYTGFVLTVAGLLLTIWARFLLGRNWSDRHR